MQRSGLGGLTAVVLAGIVAGCGSSGSSPSSSTASNAAGASGQSSAGAYGQSSAGAYGQSSSTASNAAGGYDQSSSRSAASAPASAPHIALIATKRGKLGPILAVGPTHLTVYLFEADRGRASACTGACAKFWPPVTGTPKAGGSALARDLGTITRADGSKQVTYKGHPLYRFAKDKDGGDAYGEGVVAFGGGWYVLRPNGAKVDRS